MCCHKCSLEYAPMNGNRVAGMRGVILGREMDCLQPYENTVKPTPRLSFVLQFPAKSKSYMRALAFTVGGSNKITSIETGVSWVSCLSLHSTGVPCVRAMSGVRHLLHCLDTRGICYIVYTPASAHATQILFLRIAVIQCLFYYYINALYTTITYI